LKNANGEWRSEPHPALRATLPEAGEGLKNANGEWRMANGSVALSESLPDFGEGGRSKPELGEAEGRVELHSPFASFNPIPYRKRRLHHAVAAPAEAEDNAPMIARDCDYEGGCR
jgi:hypothetical protein